MTRNRPHLGALAMLTAMLLFACMDTISKWLVGSFPILQLMWARSIAFSLLAILLLRRDGLAAALRSKRPVLQGFCALLLVIEGAVFVLALKYMPLADAHALGSTSPLAVVALSAVFLRERVDAGRWLAVVAGCAGVFLILRPGFHDLAWTALIPGACIVMWSSYQILSRICSQADGSDTTMAWSAFVALAFTSLCLPWNWVMPQPREWGLIAALAVLGAGATYCFIRALDFAPASVLQPFSYSVLVWVSLLGWIVFGDVPDIWTMAGAAVIVASGLYTWRRDTEARAGELAAAAKPAWTGAIEHEGCQ